MAKRKIEKQHTPPAKTKKPLQESYPMIKWLAGFTAIISIAISYTTVEPTISIRYLLTGIFCLCFGVYFYWIKKEIVATSPL